MITRRSGRAAAATAAILAVLVGSTPLAAAQGEEAAAETAAESTGEAAAEETPAAPIEQPAGESAPAASWPAGEGAPASGTPIYGDAPDYEIGAGDVVRVAVWRNPELSAEVPVRPDGRISVPLLGDLQAAGLTTARLREQISAGLSEYVTAPDVTVTVSQVNSKVVYVVGEVLRPAAIPLNRQMRVLDAIAVAGGFSPFADKGDIKVLRPLRDGTIEEHEFHFGRFVKGKKPESNLVLEPGDTIVVPD
jgi:polysaccharide export outer membrane protein